MKSTFLTILSISLLLLGLNQQVWGQITLGIQDFETTPATPTMTYSESGSVGTAGVLTGTSESGDKPESTNWASDGSRAYGVLNTSRTLTFSAVNTVGYTSISFSCRIASWSISSTGNGADATDQVTVEVSPDNGTTWYTRVKVNGNSNAWWSYSATGTASNTYAPDNVSSDYAPSGGGQRTTDGYSTIAISSLPSVSQLRIRITLLNNSTNERWTVDQVTITGTSSATPTITLHNNTQITSGNVTQGTTDHLLSSFRVAVADADATLNQISFTAGGTFVAGDITNFKLFTSTTNSFPGGTPLSTVSATSIANGGTVTFGSLSQTCAIGDRYFWIAADIAGPATVSNTVNVPSLGASNFTFAAGTPTGIIDAGGAQTIIACTTPTNITGLTLTPSNTQIQVAWTNPSCYDEVMIIAKATSSISGTPTGDGTGYTANLTFGSGTAFDGGYVVYKGSTSPQTITGLSNGTTYYVKVFTRKGTTWSSGEESSGTPVLANATAILWSSASGSAWLTGSNWTGSAVPTSTQVAQFGVNPTGTSGVGINFNSTTNAGTQVNGSRIQEVGAVELTSARTDAHLIGNSSSTSGATGQFRLNGVVVNSIENVVIRNNSAHNLTIQNTQGSGNQTMAVLLNNSTNNRIVIDGSGNVIISSVISSAAGPVTISGSGSGTVEFSGQNTYTTNTVVSSTTLRLNRTGGATLPATNNVTVNGGTLRVSTNQTLNNLTINSGGNLMVDSGVTLTINGTMTVDENITIAGNLTISSGGSAEIAAGKSLTVSGTLSNSGTFTIKSNASGTGSLIHSSSGVSATVERYVAGHANVAADGWHLLGSPVATFNILGSSFAPGTSDDLYGWSESTNTWLNYKAGNPTQIVPGTGYLVAYENTGTKTFSGNLNVSDVSISGLSYTPSQGNGWHLLGNPFASALEWNKTGGSWSLNNVAGTAKIWNSSGKSYTDIAANGIIPSAQGFFVQVNNTTNGLTIPASARVHSSTAWYKNTTPRILLSASPADGSSRQESQILIEPQASAGFDFYYDSRFLDGYAPKFYSLADGELLSTNALPGIQNGTSIPFGFVKNQHHNFVIRLEESLPGETILLKDLKLNITHNLSQQPEYLFSAADGDDPNRFLVVFGTVGINEKPNNQQTLQAAMHNGQLWVNNPAENSLLSIHDLSGRLLQQMRLQHSGLQQLGTNLRPGAYLIRLQGNNQTLSTKVINR